MDGISALVPLGIKFVGKSREKMYSNASHEHIFLGDISQGAI